MPYDPKVAFRQFKQRAFTSINATFWSEKRLLVVIINSNLECGTSLNWMLNLGCGYQYLRCLVPFSPPITMNLDQQIDRNTVSKLSISYCFSTLYSSWLHKLPFTWSTVAPFGDCNRQWSIAHFFQIQIFSKKTWWTTMIEKQTTTILQQ